MFSKNQREQEEGKHVKKQCLEYDIFLLCLVATKKISKRENGWKKGGMGPPKSFLTIGGEKGWKRETIGTCFKF